MPTTITTRAAPRVGTPVQLSQTGLLVQPFLAYLTIEPYQSRLEVLASVRAVRQWIEAPVDTTGVIPADSAAAFADRVAGLVANGAVVSIDGTGSEPIDTVGAFVTVGATPGPIPARYLVHQEGVLGLLALVGLSLREEGPLPYLLPRGPLLLSLLSGVAVGLIFALVLWLARRLRALSALELWQRQLVERWSVGDALAVALLSGIAEEALLRALLQPLLGLIPAAVIFAVLHLIPDRTLWFWPVMALLIGLVFGLVFERFGYPAAAVAHAVLNAISLCRLREPRESDSS